MSQTPSRTRGDLSKRSQEIQEEIKSIQSSSRRIAEEGTRLACRRVTPARSRSPNPIMMDTAPLIDVQSEREKGNEETDDGRCGYVHADPALSYPLLDGVPEQPGFTADDSNSSYFDQNSSAAVKSPHSASGASAGPLLGFHRSPRARPLKD